MARDAYLLSVKRSTDRGGSSQETVERMPQEEVLVELLRRGDTDALAHLFRLYARLVRSVAFRILRDQAEADDLVQDLFLYVYKKGRAFDDSKSTVRSWIVQMAYHRAIDRRRYLVTRNHYVTDRHDLACDEAGIADKAFDRSIASALDGRRLERALATLTRDQQQTLRLYFYDGYTLQEIAERLGQSIGNVRHHYYRGLDGLRKQVLRR